MPEQISTEDKEKQPVKKTKRPWWKRAIRILLKVIVILICLVIILIFIIRSPWGQNFIVQKAVNYLSEKTHTKVEIKRLFVTFSGNIALEGVYLEDRQGDTLLYSKSLEAAIPLVPILKGQPISIDDVQWDGLRANVVQLDSVNGFNYQFLIDAFVSDTTEIEEEPIDTVVSKPLQIAIGEIDFTDFKVHYYDALSGMKADLKLGELHFEGEDFDLEHMKFHIADAVLRNTQLAYTQSKPFPDTPEDTTETILPFVRVDNFELENVQAHYQSVPDSMLADVKIGQFVLALPKADLQNQSIAIETLNLSDSDVYFKMLSTTTDTTELTEPTTDQDLHIAELWPGWEVTLTELNWANNAIQFQNGPLNTSLKGFNPNALDIRNLNVQINDLHLYKTPQFIADLENLSFDEASGIALKQLASQIKFDSTAVRLNEFDFELNNSVLQGDATVNYTRIDQLLNHPENVAANLNLPTISVDLKDILGIMPDLKTIPYLSEVAQHPITGWVKAQGTMRQLNLEDLQLHWGKHAHLMAKGKFVNLTDPEKLKIQASQFKVQSTKSALANFVSEEEFGVRLPERIDLQAQVDGSMQNLAGTATLRMADSALVNLKGQWQNTDSIRFDVNLQAKNIALNEILIDSTLGNLGFQVTASGSGTELADLTAKLNVDFSQLDYNGYDYSPLGMQGYLKNGKGDFAIFFNDRNLEMATIASVELDSLKQKVNLMFNVDGADLHALKLMDKRLRTRLLFTAQIEHSSENTKIESHVANVTAVYNKEIYHLGELDLTGTMQQDSTAFAANSGFLNANLHSNTNFGHLGKALGRHFKRYFSDSITPVDSITRPVQLHMDMQLSESKFINEIFMPEIHKMDPLAFTLDYNQAQNLLTSTLMLPYVDYAENQIKGLQLIVNASKEAGVFVFGVNKIDAGAFVMNQTNLIGELKKGVLTLDLEGFNEQGKKFYATQVKLYGRNQKLYVYTSPESMLLNGEKWHIPEDNLIVLKKDSILATNVVMTHGDQKMMVANDLEQTDQSNIGFGFKNFKLKSLLALLNPDDYLASGQLQGNIVAENPFGNMGFIADFGIDDLHVLGAELGQLRFDAHTEATASHYFFNTSLKGSDVDLHTTGDYLAAEQPQLNFDFVIDKFGFKTIAQLSQNQLSNAEGYLSGRLSAKGQLKALQFNGFLQFNEAAFKVAQLNSTFYLDKDRIELDNDGIRFKDFLIRDENKNPFYINGAIITDNFLDPKLDIVVKANDFQLMNSTAEDNELYYGSINLDADGTITGRATFPKINLEIGVNKGTDFTYVMSEEQAALESREGVVEFVNKMNPDDILTRNTDSVRVSRFGNMQLRAKLNIDKEAAFGVVIDPRTGDNFKISGEGDLDFRYTGTGDMALTGRYIISGGHYKMSLYNLVKREFEFVPGGSVVWQGNPLDADLDVTAQYRVKTSALGLMAAQISGANEAEKNKYRQVLPFIVSMSVKGTIDRPELSFGLDMPEDSRGAIGGSVYGRITQLKEDEGEINKQVFSLLVMNRFFPASGSDGSQGGIANMARNNISQALSDQLNNFSDKLMGDTGFKLNFGVDNYTDYQGQSAQQRTDLNISAEKSLFNDRLVIKAGTEMNVQGEARPGEENPLLGNVSIEYLLTKDGRWRITGFRKNEYENVIDGQVYVNGIGLLFQRQFNKFNALWHSFFGGKTKREKQQEQAKHNDKAISEDNAHSKHQ